MKALSYILKRPIDTVVGLSIVAVVANCITPVNSWLAQQAIPILLSCLSIGGLSFLLKRQFLMSVSFLSCIVLCSFLKEAQNRNFVYARSNKGIEIKVAHFTPKDDEARQRLLGEVANFGANLISIQMPADTNYELSLKQKLSATHHFYKKLSYPNDIGIMLFSTYPIQDLDTVFLEDAPSLAGSIWIDSIHDKVHFFSTHIADLSSASARQTAQEKLHRISAYLEQRGQEKPLLTLGNIQLTAWSPEVRQFKSNTALNDSRIDLDWMPCEEHIFYSNHLQCIAFSTVLEGMGVLGTYQFRKPSQKSQDTAFSNTSVKKQITMF